MLLRTLSPLLLAAGALAQTSFPEIEPNGQKSQATVVNGMIAGDSLTGTTTGAGTALNDSGLATADIYRIRTGALPLGIYKHTLTLTTSGSAGHVESLRGLPQTNGVIGTTDMLFQLSSLSQTAWYGFGKQEQIHYQVQGTGATTGTYTATLTTASVTPINVVGTLHAGLITITTAGQGHSSDTELYVYDSNLTPVPLGHNDGLAGNSVPSTVKVALTAGTYYVADSLFNTSNNQSDLAPSEGYDDNPLLEFPDAMCSASTISPVNVAFSVSDGTSTIPVPATKTSSFQVVWATFTVLPPVGPPANDSCANAAVITSESSGYLAPASNDGAASCDPGSIASRDLWYSFTANSLGGTISPNTCLFGTETVLTLFNSCGGSEIACNDDCPGAPCNGVSSCLAGITLAPNQNVLIRVSDKGSGGGIFTLKMNFVSNTPSNDSCGSPIVLPGPGVYPFDTSFATSGQGTTGACQNPPGKNLWYEYTATANGTLIVSTCGQTTTVETDTEIWLHQGPGCPIGPALACNDDAPCGLESTVTTPTTCGLVYMIELGNWDTVLTVNIAGTFTVTEPGPVCGTPSTPFCDGSAVGTACTVCGNNGAPGNGCANSGFAVGGNLASSGFASVGADSLTLTATNITGPGLFFQGNGLAASPIPFGDGMLCAAVGIIRLGVVFPSGGSATYPGGLTPNPITVGGGPINPGDIKHYQCWYRDAIVFCTASTFNLTQGVSLQWVP
jgi:hypothetical protein